VGVKSAPEIILYALDVILPEIGSGLNFDEDKFLRRGVLDAMKLPNGDVYRVSDSDLFLVAVKSEDTFTLDDHPMLGTKLVTLVRESLPRLDFDPLDLVYGRLL
jgi:hypothetical protein